MDFLVGKIHLKKTHLCFSPMEELSKGRMLRVEEDFFGFYHKQSYQISFEILPENRGLALVGQILRKDPKRDHVKETMVVGSTLERSSL